jgi:hypothetical protein
MKQQIIELKKRLLLVELPKGYVVVSVFPPKRTLTIWNENGQYITEKLDFDVDEIGKLTDITDNQCEEWVESYTSLENRFRNYTAPAYIEFLMKTAKESFFSYLERQGILFSNPLGEFPTKQNTGLEYGMEYISKVQNWEEAESKLWDINRCWIFEIL